MNTLKTIDNGGFPWELDDWRWAEAGIKDAFKMLSQAFTGGDCILSGCVISSSGATPTFTYTMTAGIALIDGELCRVPAVVAPTVAAGARVYLGKVITFDPAGNEAFEDTVVRGTYQITSGGIIGAATIPAGRLNAEEIGEGDYLPPKVLSLIISQRFNFTERIKLQAPASPTKTIAAAQGGSLDFLNFGNTFLLTFGNAITTANGYSGAASSPGQFVIIKAKAGDTNRHFTLKHKSGVVGLRNEFSTRTGQDLLIYDGDIIYMYFDGEYWFVTSEHAPAAKPIAPTGSGWSGVFNVRKGPGRLVDIDFVLSHAAYTTTVNNLVLTLPAGFTPVSQFRSFVCWERATKVPCEVFVTGLGGSPGDFTIAIPGMSADAVQIIGCISYYCD